MALVGVPVVGPALVGLLMGVPITMVGLAVEGEQEVGLSVVGSTSADGQKTCWVGPGGSSSCGSCTGVSTSGWATAGGSSKCGTCSGLTVGGASSYHGWQKLMLVSCLGHTKEVVQK